MNLFERIKNALKEKGVKGTITKNSVVKDLGIDSLDLMDLVLILEEEEKVRISDDTLIEIKTINDLIVAVEKLK